MRPLSLIAIGLGLLVGVGQAAPKPPVKDEVDDAKKFVGDWTITLWQQAGTVIDQDQLDTAKWVVKGDKYTFEMGGNPEEGTLKIDPKAKMPTVDLIITEGNDKGKEQPGIYKIDGDTITLCMSFPGVKERPTDFTSTEDNRQILVTLKRKKKDD